MSGFSPGDIFANEFHIGEIIKIFTSTAYDGPMIKRNQFKILYYCSGLNSNAPYPLHHGALSDKDMKAARYQKISKEEMHKLIQQWKMEQVLDK